VRKRDNLWSVTGEPEQPRKFGLFNCKFSRMNLTIKKGERQTLHLDCKKVVITIEEDPQYFLLFFAKILIFNVVN
jgi:hypothetical protein